MNIVNGELQVRVGGSHVPFKSFVRGLGLGPVDFDETPPGSDEEMELPNPYAAI